MTSQEFQPIPAWQAAVTTPTFAAAPNRKKWRPIYQEFLRDQEGENFASLNISNQSFRGRERGNYPINDRWARTTRPIVSGTGVWTWSEQHLTSSKQTSSNTHTQKSFLNLVKSHQKSDCVPSCFFSSFGTKRTSVSFRINWKMIITILIRFELKRSRKDFSVTLSPIFV